MTDSQTKVLYWLATHDGWHRPGQITPADYPGAASSVGRVLRSLVEKGRVEVRVTHQTKGGRATDLVYRAKSTLKLKGQRAADNARARGEFRRRRRADA